MSPNRGDAPSRDEASSKENEFVEERAAVMWSEFMRRPEQQEAPPGENRPGNLDTALSYRSRSSFFSSPRHRSLLSRPAMKVTLKEWNAVATWRWDMPEDEVCGICRVQFDGTCPTCKFPGDDCSLRKKSP